MYPPGETEGGLSEARKEELARLNDEQMKEVPDKSGSGPKADASAEWAPGPLDERTDAEDTIDPPDPLWED